MVMHEAAQLLSAIAVNQLAFHVSISAHCYVAAHLAQDFSLSLSGCFCCLSLEQQHTDTAVSQHSYFCSV
jgi:hypothetical protein